MLTRPEVLRFAMHNWLHPEFKLHWILDDNERDRLVNVLNRRMQNIASNRSTIVQPADNIEANLDNSASETEFRNC